ncbi:MAG: ABC transporter substrate-binding protein [Actinomycetota bacterium]
MTQRLNEHRSFAPDIENITRREFIVGAGAAALLAACGRDDSGNDTSASSTGAPTTRTFVDDIGRSHTVPVEPKRIVALNDGNGGRQVVDLGFKLAGLTTRDGALNAELFSAAELEGVVPVGERVVGENLELIAALRPDLIIGYCDKATGEAYHDNLSALDAIGPPVVLIATFEPIFDVYRRFGELLGVPDQVARLEADTERKLDDIRSRMPVPPEDVTVASVYLFPGDTQFRLNSPGIGVLTRMLTKVGVPFSAASPPGTEQKEVSFEQMELLEADVLFYLLGAELPGPAQALFDRLRVVQAGQAVSHDRSVAGNVLRSLNGALDAIDRALTDPNLDATLVP